MNKSKLPFDINVAIKNFAGHCPMCGREAQDRRYKRRADGPILTTRRFTKRSITRECRVCGLRFSFTWITFVNSLRKKAKEIKPGEDRERIERLATFIEDNV